MDEYRLLKVNIFSFVSTKRIYLPTLRENEFEYLKMVKFSTIIINRIFDYNHHSELGSLKRDEEFR